MALWQWSTTPANNATAATAINWAEGQPPSSVNDSARQMMADVAAWYQVGPEWLNYGLPPTYVSSTQFTVPGNQTTIYSLGRRVKATVAAGTIYGSISASSYGSSTAVTVAWDSGHLDNGVSEVDVGILNPLFSSLPTISTLSVGSLSVTGANGINLPNQVSPNVASVRFGDGTGWTLRFQKLDGSSTFATLKDTGDLSLNGVLTAASDERLKTDWEALPEDIIEQAAGVLSGLFTRISTGTREAGVGAQSLQKVLPQVVHQGEHLSVAYGNAALVLAIKLCQRIVKLQKRIETLEA
jgi:hypothetical protein